MADKFAKLEQPKSRTLAGVLAVLFIVTVFLLFQWSGSAPTQLHGVVESAGAINLGRTSGGTRESAMVRLDDRTLVKAYVISGGPLTSGDKVALLEEHRLLGGPIYQVVAKDLSH